MSERIQKLLATVGIGSRREIERFIEAGRISVNGETAKLGDKADYSDVLCLDGKRLNLQHRPEIKHRVLAYHKPEGEICSRSDPEGRATIFDRLPKMRSGRWIAVGRLDINTSGIILLTTDGELANRLMHPSSEIEREYATRVMGEVGEATLQRLRKGVKLEDGLARFTSIRDAGGQGINHWYHVTLNEGRNREVRRLWESQDLRISRLIRVRYGIVSLRRDLKPGQWDELDHAAINQLRETVGLPAIEALNSKTKKTVKRGSVRRPGPKRRA